MWYWHVCWDNIRVIFYLVGCVLSAYNPQCQVYPILVPGSSKVFAVCGTDPMSKAAQVQGLGAKCRLPCANGFHLVCLSSLPRFHLHSEEKQDSFKRSLIALLRDPSWIKSSEWANDWSLPQLPLCWNYGEILMWSSEALNHLMFQLYLSGSHLPGSSCSCKTSQELSRAPAAVLCAELS